ncbi:hypothetical protein [Embleya sp. NPDC020886]|uniref:hypothetical protein n=1 Tax=Embleya sp. NPDC020886 TaxID=3363980 RepID=UPI00378E09D1
MAFIRPKITGFAGAIGYPAAPWQALFLRGDKVAVINESALLYAGDLAGAGGGRLDGVIEPYRFATDGLLQLPDGPDGSRQTMFLRGDTVLVYDWERGVVRDVPWTRYDNWGTGLPAGYRSGIDAIVLAPDSADGTPRTHFFKGPRVLTLHPVTGVEHERPITEGPDPQGCAGWAQLPADFRADLDHVLVLPPAEDGTHRSLLIKGDTGCLLDWAGGVRNTGPLTTLLPGLAALPAPFTTCYRPVSGRYVGLNGTGRVELRIDVDGDRALGAVSGDLFTVTGGTTTYRDSFRASGVEVLMSEQQVQIDVTGSLGFAKPGTRTDLRVVIPRSAAGQPQGNADLILGGPARDDTEQWSAAYESTAFRSVDVETDNIAGTVPFTRYDTSTGPAPAWYRHRVATVAGAYAEAGIELRTAGTTNVPADTSGADLRWSEAELHAAMVANFSLRREVPQWKLWTFVTTRHTKNGVIGIMFDQSGAQRQGMAVFHRALVDFGLVGRNHEFHTYVHELGHAFNLLHAWQKDLAKPPAPLGPNNGFGDLSWMNYPQNYRSSSGEVGEEAFWGAFAFRFSDDELRHLRHGFYRHVVPGGDNFVVNSAIDLGAAAEAATAPIDDESGLRLELGGKAGYEYGEPVMAELKLSRTGTRGDVTVIPELSPKSEHLAIFVTDPQGRTRLFRPIARLCTGHGTGAPMVTLTASEPALYDTAYLGYGSDGLYFPDPGRYRITAVYHAPDGSRVVSAARVVRVRHPITRTEQEIGDLFLGDQQGTLLALLGSDAPQLREGNDALAEIVEKYGTHPLAAYARLARGANAGRHFQHLRNGRVEVRRPDFKESISQLTAAIEASRGDDGLDNITLNAAMRRLATVHAKEGDVTRAGIVLDRMAGHFGAKRIPAQVQRHIRAQAEATRRRITEPPN